MLKPEDFYAVVTGQAITPADDRRNALIAIALIEQRMVQQQILEQLERIAGAIEDRNADSRAVADELKKLSGGTDMNLWQPS